MLPILFGVTVQRTWSYLNHTLRDKVKRYGDSKPEAKVQEALEPSAPLPAWELRDQSLGTPVGSSVLVHRTVWWKVSGTQSYDHWCGYFSGSSGSNTTIWGLEQPLKPSLSGPNPHPSLIPQQYWTPEGKQGSFWRHVINSVSLKEPNVNSAREEHMKDENLSLIHVITGRLVHNLFFSWNLWKRGLYFEMWHPPKSLRL